MIKRMKYWEVMRMNEEKNLKDEIQDFYLNGGTYNEEEIDFGKPQGEEISD